MYLERTGATPPELPGSPMAEHQPLGGDQPLQGPSKSLAPQERESHLVGSAAAGRLKVAKPLQQLHRALHRYGQLVAHHLLDACHDLLPWLDEYCTTIQDRRLSSLANDSAVRLKVANLFQYLGVDVNVILSPKDSLKRSQLEDSVRNHVVQAAKILDEECVTTVTAMNAEKSRLIGSALLLVNEIKTSYAPPGESTSTANDSTRAGGISEGSSPAAGAALPLEGESPPADHSMELS